jgi:hypothetical protein
LANKSQLSGIAYLLAYAGLVSEVSQQYSRDMRDMQELNGEEMGDAGRCSLIFSPFVRALLILHRRE